MPPESKLRLPDGARAALLLAVVLAAGCGGDDALNASVAPPVSALWLDSLTFTVETGVNANRPVRVALVQVQDTGSMSELTRIESTAWFGMGGDAFRRAHPEAFVHDWELVPGRVAGPYDVAVDALVAGVLFCETGAGSPPLPVERHGDVTVAIGDGGCTLGGGSSSSREGLSGGWGISNPFDLFNLNLFGWFD